LRDRLRAIARRRSVEFLHRMLARVDPPSALRIQPRDEMRLVRALEVYFLTGRSLTDLFAQTVSPLAGWEVVAIALALPSADLAARLERRVHDQFARGLLDEIRGLLARGVPETAHPFTGLVYRQALEQLHGLRDEAATRQLIVRENRRYARRQLIWFRKEPNLIWFRGSGQSPATLAEVACALDSHFGRAHRLGMPGVPAS
jgi:tRNA dimethylallyltransferase